MNKKLRTVTVPDRHVVAHTFNSARFPGPSSEWLAALEVMMAKKGYKHVRRAELLLYIVW